MLIPRVSHPCLYCVKAGTPDAAPVERPAMIVRVNAYDPTSASVNLQVFTDGIGDSNYFGNQSEQGLVHVPEARYDAGAMEIGTFRYLDEKSMRGPRIEEIRVTNTILHGRETILKDAPGIWDQLKNTLRFPTEFIEGMHADHQPEYKADDFIDWHIARIFLPKGYVVIVQPAPIDGRERPSERGEYMDDLMEQWENSEWGTPYPSTVQRSWPRGGARRRMIEDIDRQVKSEDRPTIPGRRTPLIPSETGVGEEIDRGVERSNRKELASV